MSWDYLMWALLKFLLQTPKKKVITYVCRHVHKITRFKYIRWMICLILSSTTYKCTLMYLILHVYHQPWVVNDFLWSCVKYCMQFFCKIWSDIDFWNVFPFQFSQKSVFNEFVRQAVFVTSYTHAQRSGCQ
jgi:hypothetical protein